MLNVKLPRATGRDDTQWPNRVVNAVDEAFGKLDAEPLREAQIVGPVAIATTDTSVYHSLGRIPRGYILVQRPSDVRVFDGATPSTQPSAFLTLRASSAATVTLLVF